MEKTKPRLYGTQWCTKSSGIRNYLQSRWIDFDFFDVEKDESAAAEVRAMYDGKLKFPTLVIGEKRFKNPSIADIKPFVDELDK